MRQKKLIARAAARRKAALAVFLGAVLLCGCAPSPQEAPEPQAAYGVFLGRTGDEADGLERYATVVIEPEEFTAVQISALHEAGCTVYGYLNIGAIETYRGYYERFEALSLGVYETWPDERWVDVSGAAWQAFVTQELAPNYLELGLDGFFLDNADVYYQFQTEAIFGGLCAILRGLRELDPHAALLINGGDVFVTRCIEEGTASALFDGVDQETVFTAVDFDTQSFHRQQADETAYFRDYLQAVKTAGLRVYLLEYGADEALAAEIDAYCRDNGFAWYNAPDLNLD